eukprot:1381590-Rhodomonas_salina.1
MVQTVLQMRFSAFDFAIFAFDLANSVADTHVAVRTLSCSCEINPVAGSWYRPRPDVSTARTQID